jgi:tetratricopeptide (TPR) repeat protein
LPAILHNRLAEVAGLRTRLDLEGSLRQHPAEVLLEGALSFAPGSRSRPGVIGWTIQLREAEGEPLLTRGERFQPTALFRKIEQLACDVAQALGLKMARRVTGRGPRTFVAIRDYLRATDLDDGRVPLELEDRRLALEWLLLSVEADPSFRPARDALLESVLRAHEAGLHGEARRSLYMAARLSPRDARVPFVHGELAWLDGMTDEAVAAYRRCLRLEPGHGDAHFKLGLLMDREGDRGAAKQHFKAAGRRGCVEALLLYGILCAEDGERRKARSAWARAEVIDPSALAGLSKQGALDVLFRSACTD